MITQQLLDYIKQSLNQGISKEEIKNTLLSHNWTTEDIELAFKMAAEPTNASIISSQSTIVSSKRLLSFTELFKNTIDLYKKKFFTFIGITVIASVISIILLLLIAKTLQVSPLSFFANLIILFLLSLFTGLIQFISQIALIYALKEDKISIIQAYQNSLANILNLIWINILTFLIVFSLPLACITVGFIIKSAFMPLLILSAFLLLIPGLIFLLWFIFGNYVLVIENTKGIKALIRSREYAKGQVNNIFSRSVSVGFLAAIPLLIIDVILVLLKIPSARTITIFISNILLLPFTTAFLYLLYSNIKALKVNQIISEKPKEQTLFSVLVIAGLIMLVILSFKAISYFSSELKSMQNKAQELKIISDMGVLKNGLEYYSINNDKYPQSLDELFATYPDLYNRKPIDPITNKPYYYEVLNNGKAFKLCSGFGTSQENCITSQ